MIRVIVHGCSGVMGQAVVKMVQDDPDMEIAAGIDPRGAGESEFPVYKNIADCKEAADVIIDFSTAGAIDSLLSYCEERKLSVVLCTTGLSEEQLRHISGTSAKTAVLKSANMSLGINLLMKLLKEAAEVLGPADYDVEIVERHHNRKLDAPSGTAISLADAVNSGLERKYSYNYNRSGERKKREHDEIGIASVRAGNIVGEHEVIFAGTDEIVEFKHTACSRAVFAQGAVEAAKFLAGKAPGMYDMADVIADRH